MMQNAPREMGIRQRVALLQDARPLRTRMIEAVAYDPGQDPAAAQVAAPGTVTVLLARSGSQRMQEVREQLKEKSQVDAGLLDKVFEPLRRHQRVPAAEVPKLLEQQPVFAEVRYGSKALTGPLFVPEDLEVCVVTCPYNGGRLAQSAFTLVERYEEGSAEALDAVVVIRSPALSNVERAALNLLDDAQLETNVGFSVPTQLPRRGEEYHVVPAEGNEPGEYYYVEHGPELTAWRVLFEATNLSQEELRRLGPAASARKLLTIRRERLLMRG